ncbi:hypothetical protein PCE1_001243 [Barthelona sp. PCE]
MADNFGTFTFHQLDNEPINSFKPGSEERELLTREITRLRGEELEIPCVINGVKHFTGNKKKQTCPHDHQHVLGHFHCVTDELVHEAIDGALAAKAEWEDLPANHRAAIFARAADLLATKYRYKMLAAVMLSIGKTPHQAVIDVVAELADFWRMNAQYLLELMKDVQPPIKKPNGWNRMTLRPLEGFTYAISPWNFVAIAGNLPTAPAMIGNVALWKPSSAAVYPAYLIYEILMEAGLPAGVIQFIPGISRDISAIVLPNPNLSAIHFTGSTPVFVHLWQEVAKNLPVYKTYPRLVGETGGKNFHFLAPDFSMETTVNHTIRGAFEYSGQKCSATSRVYCPASRADEFTELMVKIMEEHVTHGPVEDFSVFTSSVIDENSFDKIASYIDFAKESDSCEIMAGGTYDKSTGYFVAPTFIKTTDPHCKLMAEEIFGPVVTMYTYEDDKIDETLELCNTTSEYGLTGAIFGLDRHVVNKCCKALKHAAGNMYINRASTAAVVGQQPFGGARKSGTDDKAGSPYLLLRFAAMQSISEDFFDCQDITYPHMK